MPNKSENASYSTETQHIHFISDSVTLRICSDTSPQNLKTADLQKGIILLHKGAEVIGEGTGFGVPIAKYSDETFFSSSAFLQIEKQENLVIIRKEFSMDRVLRDKIRNLKLENIQARKLIDFFSDQYQKHKRLAQIILWAKQYLLKLGINSVFVKAIPKGKVTVTYTLEGNRILVKLNFNQLDRSNLQKVFVLNEHSALFFRKYSDSEGLALTDEEIGAWNIVTAQFARIADNQGKIGFNLKNVDGAILRRGREFMEGSLDWIGLDYELDGSCDQFEYEIEILG
jgi:hypothetical protein